MLDDTDAVILEDADCDSRTDGLIVIDELTVARGDSLELCRGELVRCELKDGSAVRELDTSEL